LCPNKKPFAGEFVREEMEHVCQGVHGARSTKQAIAIGLSKARRAGVDLPPPGKKASSARSSKRTSSSKSSRKRAKSSLRALRREGSASASPAGFPVSHKPAPASAVPQAVVAPPRKLRKPGLTIGTSGAANHQAGARLPVEAALRRHLVGRSLALTARAWRLLGLQPRGNGFAIFPGGWYIKSSTPLPPNPDSEFLPLDSYSPLPFYRPGFSRLIQIFVGG
jgi:hypothetical protein